MQALNELITAAVQLAGADDLASHNARLWKMEGGRACPIGWGDCSQPVYVDVKTGAYDYGERGGPGHADCVRNCRHGMNPPDDDEDSFHCDDCGHGWSCIDETERPREECPLCGSENTDVPMPPNAKGQRGAACGASAASTGCAADGNGERK